MEIKILNRVIYPFLFIGLLFGCAAWRNRFYLSDIGFSMRLPENWKQGVPKVNGKSWMLQREGECFFSSKDKYLPYGKVTAISLKGKNWKEYVAKELSFGEKSKTFQLWGRTSRKGGRIIKMEVKKVPEKKLIYKREIKVSGLKGIEALVEDSSLKFLILYILKDIQIIRVEFDFPKKEFSKYMPSVHKCIQSIRIQ